MAIRILTKNSVDNTNIDGARQNHFNAGMRSGVVEGALNECNVTSPASNQIVINTGELRISGHQIVITESEQMQLTNTPQTATDYSIVTEVSVDDLGTPTFRMFIQPQNSGLIQDNLFATLNGVGTYQIKLANFTQNTDGGIFNLERVADLIGGVTKEQIESVEKVDVVYDIASKPLTHSNGISAGSWVNIDLTKYKLIRFYANYGDRNQLFATVNLSKTSAYNYYLGGNTVASITDDFLIWFEAWVHTYKNGVQFRFGTFNTTKTVLNENGYVYRIEGVYNG